MTPPTTSQASGSPDPVWGRLLSSPLGSLWLALAPAVPLEPDPPEPESEPDPPPPAAAWLLPCWLDELSLPPCWLLLWCLPLLPLSWKGSTYWSSPALWPKA